MRLYRAATKTTALCSTPTDMDEIVEYEEVDLSSATVLTLSSPSTSTPSCKSTVAVKREKEKLKSKYLKMRQEN
jgi:hypothetical protein